jgi:beta-glucosidase
MKAWGSLVVAGIVLGLLATSLRATPRNDLKARDTEVRTLLAKMTLEEKIGQMTQADQEFIKDPKDVQTYFLGSVLSGGSSDPANGNEVEHWRALHARYQDLARGTRLKIPLLYGVDAVHGHSNVVGAVLFPHNVGLGATRDPQLVEEIGRVTASEVRATGIEWAFAPCVTVPQDDRWGRAYEGFSEDPELVAQLGAAAVRGLQGMRLGEPDRVLACAKHFVGDGGTKWGTGTAFKDRNEPAKGRYPIDRGDVVLSEAELRRLHLPGYVSAIEAGVGSVMVSYNSWNGTKASASRHLVTEVLKQELGFDGLVVSDWNALDELPGDVPAQVRGGVEAGIDMFMVPDKYKEFEATLRDLVMKKVIPMSRIDDAVTRVLRVKYAMGLMDPSAAPAVDPAKADSVGSRAHRAVARRAVRESLVLLKNEKSALPLDKNAKRLVVVGAAADDLGAQCGGWTITWQGRRGPVTTGTTIYGALRQAASAKAEVDFSPDGSNVEGADAAVVVMAEPPYSEFMGDREDLGVPARDLEMLQRVKRTGVPTILVILSGRPLILGAAVETADAIVAAWLPGSEGQGVADVLFGDARPTGKLPVSWPRTMADVPVNKGDGRTALFPYGYGLSY